MTKKFEVLLIEDAEEDVYSICKYVATHDSVESAEYVFSALQDTCISLETLPDRGHVPPELDRIGVYDYLEIHFKPYRIIYQIREHQLFIHCVLDGRRSLQDLLQERLIR